MFDFMSFMRVHKYPPSLLYLCVTGSIGLALLAWFERIREVKLLTLFGRTPMFFYVIHIALAHFLGNVYYTLRFGAVPQFDNVSDYNGCQMNTGTASPGCDTTGSLGIRDINNNAIGPATGYSASIAVAALTSAFSGIAALDVNSTPQVLLITVTVTGSDNVPVVLEGIRTRYSPRGVP